MAAPSWRKISQCRVCGDNGLEVVADLGTQALASLFPKSGEADPERIPLVLVRCPNCGLVQLQHSVVPSALYTHGYGYRSGINATMRTHLAGLAQWVRQRCTHRRGDIVLDLGCNDGTLLKAFGDGDGLMRVGIDAVADKFRDDYPRDILIHEGYFTADAFAGLCGGRKAAAITSIAMFYDLESPHEFVAAIKGALAPDGIWVLEQSYLPAMLETNAYDTICHEHLEYYALRQIEWLAAEHGLRVFDVELNASNGGSFRLAVCHREASHPENRTAIERMREKEKASGLDGLAPFHAFARRIAALRSELVAFVDKQRAAGKSVYVYGASTKGNTLLQYRQLDATRITAAAERNPEKFGCRTPGTGIPIISEEEARAARPSYFLVLPWHFREEFVERERTFLQSGGQLVFPLPWLEIVAAPR